MEAVKLMLVDLGTAVLRRAVDHARGSRIRIEHLREACKAAPPEGLGMTIYGCGEKKKLAKPRVPCMQQG